MKGLLLKDFYMIAKYCRAFFLIIAVFIAVSCFGDNNLFFIVYPTLFAGMIPVTLISYDEREKWDVYSLALPVSRAQTVSSKYLAGLLLEFTVFLISSAAQAFRMISTNAFSSGEYLSTIVSVFTIGLIGPSILLPFIFRFGAEKGRIAYYIIIGALSAIGVILAGTGFRLSEKVSSVWIVLGAAALAIMLYFGSWRLSVLLYKKQEL